jgi:LPXTG-motif cell wall-anchored protein
LSGTAVILGIAKAIQDVPTNYNIVFAFWGSEELGLRGSRHFYSSTLAPDEYWKNIVAYYNLDMAATSQTSNSYLTIHTPYRADGDSTKPLRSWAGDQVAEQAERYWAYANSNGQLDAWWKRDWVDPVTGQAGVTGLEYFGNCSDHASISGANTGVAFESAIPQVYTFWRDAGANSSTGDVTELNYHVVGDRLAWPGDPFTIQGESQPYQGNISPERAKILGSVYLLALVKTAQGPVYPQALDIETSGTKGRLRATWDAPNDGGSPITGYTLTLTPDAAVLGALPVTAQVPPSATSYTFDDLPVGDYTVKAVATNVIGRSPLVTSSVATVTAATVPDAPSVPVLTPGEASLGVTWQPPVDDGGSTLTEYVIKFSHGLSVTIPASSPLTFELTDLEPGDYSVTLSAVNSVGQSAEVSSATVAVLPISQVTSPAPASSTVDSTPGSQPGSTSAVNGTTALSFTGTANSWLIIAALALLVSGTFTLARKRRIASELA